MEDEEDAITEITLEPSPSACIMKQKGEGGDVGGGVGGVVCRVFCGSSQALFYHTSWARRVSCCQKVVI